MATDVQKQRLEQRFKLWDKDGDGKISLSDWQGEAERIAEAFGESVSGGKGQALNNAYTEMFDVEKITAAVPGIGGAAGAVGGLAGDAAKAAASSISLTAEQFTQISDAIVIQPGEEGFNSVVAPTIRAMAQVCDTDGDGQINAEDFARWLGAIGVDRSSADESFSKIDTDGDGSITVDQLVSGARDWHFGKLDAPLLGR